MASVMWIASQCVGILGAERAGHRRAPVAALGEVAVVAEASHQCGPGVGDSFDSPPCRCRLAREAEARQRRADHMEGVGGLTAVFRRVRQRFDDLVELDDRARPTVRDHQWACLRMWRALMNEVNVDSVDRRDELVEAVQSRLAIAPVVRAAPVPAHVLDPGQGSALAPIVDGLCVGPPGLGETTAQVLERRRPARRFETDEQLLRLTWSDHIRHCFRSTAWRTPLRKPGARSPTWCTAGTPLQGSRCRHRERLRSYPAL